MNNLLQATYIELLKVWRSKMLLWTALGFALAPFMGGFFMVVMQDPVLARRLGIISTKAQIIAGVADWETYFGLLAQATAVGGILLFSIIGSWIFGREYADRTVKDLLALPTSRVTIVVAKFMVILLWSAALTLLIYLLGLGVGAAIRLPALSLSVFGQGTATLAISACLTIALVTPIAFCASAGRGYLPPIGVAILMLILAQVTAAAGWGEYFPWSIPALRAGLAGAHYANMTIVSYGLVLLTSLSGLVATFVWWTWADQNQ